MAAHVDQLQAHRIAELKTIKLRTRWSRLAGRNTRFAEHGYGCDCLGYRIMTDRGASGWGISRIAPSEQMYNLTGRAIAELFDPAAGVIAPEAMAIDVALHDVAGVILDLPVYRMLGGRGERRLWP